MVPLHPAAVSYSCFCCWQERLPTIWVRLVLDARLVQVVTADGAGVCADRPAPHGHRIPLFDLKPLATRPAGLADVLIGLDAGFSGALIGLQPARELGLAHPLPVPETRPQARQAGAGRRRTATTLSGFSTSIGFSTSMASGSPIVELLRGCLLPLRLRDTETLGQ